MTFDASGSALANSPEWQVTSTLNYERALSGSLLLTIGGDVSYKSSNEGAIQYPISDYTLVNVRMGISAANARWGVQLWGRNVFDEMYWRSSSSSNCCFVRLNGMPATYGVTFSYNQY